MEERKVEESKEELEEAAVEGKGRSTDAKVPRANMPAADYKPEQDAANFEGELIKEEASSGGKKHVTEEVGDKKK